MRASLTFPDRLYNEEGLKIARDLIEGGFRHNIKVEGSREFMEKVEESLRLVEVAGYMDFLRRYISRIVEKDGFSQLREDELTIWANKYTVSDSVEAASFFVQKAEQMRLYIQREAHVGSKAESEAINKRIQFLRDLRDRTGEPEVRKICEEKLKQWSESTLL
ncbi:MAG: hypothetical protein QXL67_00420 [Candidatus Bathyarchaeia archaeon]